MDTNCAQGSIKAKKRRRSKIRRISRARTKKMRLSNNVNTRQHINQNNGPSFSDYSEAHSLTNSSEDECQDPEIMAIDDNPSEFTPWFNFSACSQSIEVDDPDGSSGTTDSSEDSQSSDSSRGHQNFEDDDEVSSISSEESVQFPQLPVPKCVQILSHLCKDGRLEEAWKKSEKIYVQIMNTSTRDNLHYLLNFQSIIAMKLSKDGNYKVLKKCLENVLNIFESTLRTGVDYKKYLDLQTQTLDNLTQYLVHINQTDLVINFYNKLIKKLESDFGDDSPVTSIAKVCHAKCYTKNRDYKNMWQILSKLTNYVVSENDHRTAVFICVVAINTIHKIRFKSAKTCFQMLKLLKFEIPYLDGRYFVNCIKYLEKSLHIYKKDGFILKLYDMVSKSEYPKSVAYLKALYASRYMHINIAWKMYLQLCKSKKNMKPVKKPNSREILIDIVQKCES